MNRFLHRTVRGGVRVLALTAVLAAAATPVRTTAADEEAAPAAPETGYLFGVYPALPLAKLDQLFSPLAQEIGRAIGRPVRFRSASSYEKFSEQLRAGVYDLALVHPFDFVRNAEGASYRPLARKNEELTAVLVVPQNSPVQSIRDLRGKRVALPPAGAAVSLLATATYGPGHVADAGLVIKHFGEHDSSLQQMVIGNAAAAATCRAILRIYQDAVPVKLRIVAESAPLPHSVFVAHSRVPENERALITQVLLVTTLRGVPPDLRKAFLYDGKPPFVEVSADDLRNLESRIQGLGEGR